MESWGTDHGSQFIALALRAGALRFGEFTLKSGRVSPYFFNAGVFSSGAAAAALGRCYAATIVEHDLAFDCLFGPAYKGIPLVTATAIALAERHGRDVPYAFNRKEAKSHGEGGNIVGAPVTGRVLIVDDVITAGTAVREAVATIEAAGGEIAGVALALDREERGRDALSAVQELRAALGAPVVSIAGLGDLLAHLERAGGMEDHLSALQQYRRRYGV